MLSDDGKTSNQKNIKDNFSQQDGIIRKLISLPVRLFGSPLALLVLVDVFTRIFF